MHPIFTTFLRVATWACLAFIGYATLSPIEARPTVSEARYEHIAAFAVWALIVCLAYRSYWYYAAAIVFVSACLLEFAQTFVPGRHGRLTDLVDKGLGIVIGLVAFWLVSVVLRRMRRGSF